MDQVDLDVITKNTFNFTLKQIVKLLIYLGLKNIYLWDQLLEKSFKDTAEQNDILTIQLLELLQEFINSLKDEIRSKYNAQIQEDSFFERYMLDPFKDLNNINCANVFSIQIVEKFKLYVKDFLNNRLQSPQAETSKNNTELLSIFNVVNDHLIKIPQIFALKDNDCHKVFTTPGETGDYLVKIEVTNTEEIASINVVDRWRLVSKKAIFLINSDKDKKYKLIQDILKDVAIEIAQIQGVKNEVKKYTKKNKGSPY